MKSKEREALELETELLRLNTLVRQRREQLARLEKCPNPDCPCRVVWRDHVEQGLASQVHKIRKQVRSRPGSRTAAAAPKGGKKKRAA